ncbi:hypothetical protein J5N97_000855 [Dioscorea zingiberensis]|uniref:FLZ-type domain-containing protein n=1 Tax=Dioscorea zingiberensis TaxID=325984 RepID=A0A9D5H2W1_9LILI|nr:hypothetical protein J5N97_000855 [Dioscorea zingiberensis]
MPLDTVILRPKSRLERDPLSPRSWKNCDSDGVGLAIATSLEKMGSYRKAIKIKANLDHEANSGEIGETPGFPALDFLNTCYLCRKILHGKDIYMYRGEKAFCSQECRYQQIMSDEGQEKCSYVSMRTSGVASSTESGRLFFTGVTTV